LRQFDLQQPVTTAEEAASVLQGDSKDALACCVLGYSALAQAKYDEAEAWFARARDACDCAWGYVGTSLVQRHRGRVAEALASVERAISLQPELAEAHALHGDLLREKEAFEDAVDSLHIALALRPDLHAARIAYGKLMRAVGRMEEAKAHLESTVLQVPQSVDAWFELALVKNALADTIGAIGAYEQVLSTDPSHAAAHTNLGLIYLLQLGQPQRAEMMFRRAVELSPGMIQAQANLGVALHEQGRSNEAVAHYDRLVSTYPDCAAYRWHRGVVRLALGDFVRGWEDYEARKVRGTRYWRRDLPPLPEWDGSSAATTGVLIYAEQGVGDEIMFASCIPDVLATSRKCVIECDIRLASLFRRSFPKAVIHATVRDGDFHWLRDQPDVDVRCAVGSLPRLFRKSVDDFPRNAYLTADSRETDAWRQKFDDGSGRLNVGIAWRSGTVRTRQELRSTRLTEWMPLLRNQDCRFFSLQRNAADETQQLLSRHGLDVQEVFDSHDDFEQLAAAITALDLVITVEGTVVHIAGALGRPVWVLASAGCDWRYGRDTQNMPWYHSARIFRQPNPHEHDSVFELLEKALLAYR
jgi:tetratricopeptide (TPR) repeat protein